VLTVTPIASSSSLPARESPWAASRASVLVSPEQAGLRCGVVRLADVSGLADDRGDVDDPARSALDHVRQHRLRHKERARQVDRDHLVPILVGHLQHGLVNRDAGVVDQDIEAAVLLDHVRHGAPAILGRADVALVDARLGAPAREFTQKFLCVLGIPA
jgi:hypothetical protein